MTSMPTVSVIGLGTMGATLAELLLRSGYRTTVWNRTSGKATPLVREGAAGASTAAAAVAASDVVVVCVYDYDAANNILMTHDAEEALPGRLVVQMTTGSPREARDAEQWAKRHGAEYVDGAIQAAPSQMARPDTTILVSGARTAYLRSEPVLKVFGGNVKYLGESADAASTMDLATLSYVYGATLGFLHGARIAESEGLRVDHYGGLVAEIAPSFGAFLKHEGSVIQSGDFRVSESPLRISVEATERLARAARDGGIDSQFPLFASGLFAKGLKAGYADQEVAALIKILRAPE